MSLSETQIRRYSRHILLPDVGGRGQERLLAARVKVAVQAGSGSAVAALAYLAAAGVGTLVLAGDTRGPVTAEDVRLGILYGQRDIGRPRADTLSDRLLAINPDVRVTTGDTGIDVVIDAGEDPPADVAAALIAGGSAALRLLAQVAR